MEVGLDSVGDVPGAPPPVRQLPAATDRLTTWLLRTPVAVAAIAALSLFLGLFRLDRAGDGNSYYAAAVRSMLDNWHAFFFASFDRAGYVTIDKPPLGFWIQTAFARVLGFHGWSVLLPEVLATVGSVIVIYFLIRRSFGAVAGLLAALTLAIAPINVAVARNNTPDSLLVFCLLLAAAAVLTAVERGGLAWFLVGMALVGVAFNIKMLQAYLALPALMLVYLVAPGRSFWRKVWQLILGGVVALAVSLSWATVVQVIPANARPFIGSSGDNNIFNLIFGYNGLNRLLPRGWSIFGVTNASLSITNTSFAGGGVGGVSENGPQGIFRLLNTQLGGQIGWLLPVAVVGFVAAWVIRPALTGRGDGEERASWQQRLQDLVGLDRGRRGLVLWGGWLVTQVGFFSVAGFWHRYYLSILSPAIAALVGAGFVAAWRGYRGGGWQSGLLPLMLVIGAVTQVKILGDYADWRRRLTPVIVAATAVAVIGLAAALLGRRRFNVVRSASILAMVGIAGLLAAPAVWSGITVSNANAGAMPAAGPAAGKFGFGFGGGGGGNAGRQFFNFSGATAVSGVTRGRAGSANRGGEANSSLISYLEKNQGTATYLVAVRSANEAAPIILATNKAVMAMGGFSGSDPILTLDSFKQLIASGKLRFVMASGFGDGGGLPTGGPISDPGGNFTSPSSLGAGSENTGAARRFAGGRGFGGDSSAIDQWVAESCRAVPSSDYAGSTSAIGGGFGGAGSLYDCKGAA